MKKFLFTIVILFASLPVFCQSTLKLAPYLRQGGMYFSSEQITSDGYGMGLGLSALSGKHLIVQADINVYWLNGNAFSTRLAAGYRKQGVWSPAILANFTTVYGSHTEVLNEDGSSPQFPVSAVGFRLTPLRFDNDKGFVSALELGYSVGKNKAKVPELTLLAVGVCF